MTDMTCDLTQRRKKLLYRATYRGFKEADLLIGGFARAWLDGFDADELNQFETLLDVNDHELYAFAMGEKDPPAHVAGTVFQKLRNFRPA